MRISLTHCILFVVCVALDHDELMVLTDCEKRFKEGKRASKVDDDKREGERGSKMLLFIKRHLCKLPPVSSKLDDDAKFSHNLLYDTIFLNITLHHVYYLV